ncbi:uncharacterized protein CIMG_01392 [Coccidioides immitis RS]|uniref:Serine hydrolase domain-containing protein n=1 Tax=Coccidioides immitis (strain RS) TaxID=246410 RepID=J3KJ39_COCIM|nr:uncharacterized protein CIMG_01392 [Coccidioides immitis RS]EAS36038.3 hypothetical protein CIMG_01392 [Coccidioides immitis RS]
MDCVLIKGSASLRNDLPDFEFEFIQGAVPHTEGNWSLFTTSFSQLPLYNYFNPPSPQSILRTEEEVVKLIQHEGPFDGAIGYSGGAGLIAQLLIRHFRENPWKLPHERILRWAAFINGATPLEIFRLSDVEARVGIVDDSAPERELKEIFLRPSNIRVRKENERHPGYDPEELRRNIMALETRQLADGRLFMTDGRMGGPRYEAAVQGSLIDIPTLHVQCPTVDNRHGGLELMKLCEPSLVREFFFHSHGHDFPRGHYEMKIAELIREVAEKL